jgi:hypothetical protein
MAIFHGVDHGSVHYGRSRESTGLGELVESPKVHGTSVAVSYPRFGVRPWDSTREWPYALFRRSMRHRQRADRRLDSDRAAG